jgi:gliding motility-associated protein GldM
MSGQKETPRQKMIGMMYLVLTALLALNISKDILNTFVLVNDGLESNIVGFEEKNNFMYTMFEDQVRLDPIKYKASYDKAVEAKALSEALVSYIQEIKAELIMTVEGIPQEVADTINLAYVTGKDNYDIPTLIMIGDSEDGSAGKSSDLREKVEAFKGQMLAMLGDADLENFDIGLALGGGVENGTSYNWEMKNFYHTQLAPAIVLLSKLQNDVRNAEYDMVNKLLGETRKTQIPIDTIAGRVIAPTSYILVGDDYEADVIAAAYSRTKDPVIYIGEFDAEGNMTGIKDSLKVSDGAGKYRVPTNEVGMHTFGGIIKVKNMMGEETSYPFKSSYIVAKPAATVSATKMNVFYKVVDNPVSVSVPGVADDNVRVSCSNGSIRKVGKGQYLVKLDNSSKGVAQIRVSAVMNNGETRPMGTSDYRIKNLPKPYSATNGGLTGDVTLKKNELVQVRKIIGTYDRNFLFELPAPTVISCNIEFQKGGQPTRRTKVPGGNVQPIIESVRKKLNRGDKIYITDIRARDRAGIIHKMSSIIITVK